MIALADLKAELTKRAIDASGVGCFLCSWILDDIEAHGAVTDASDQHSAEGKPLFPKAARVAHLLLEKIDLGIPASEENRPNAPIHLCHWPGCGTEVPPRLWGCRPHWYLLPKWIRDAIWDAYVPGQEQRKDPSDNYIKIARIAHDWALDYEKHQKKPGGA